MTAMAVHAMPGCESQARAIADLLNVPLHAVEVHTFPDGESRVTVQPVSHTAAIFCTLDRPNEKLINLLLAATALRDGNAKRIILIAPYMCYMRQDIAFAPGQAVSQSIIGRLLGGIFDRIVTVDPHLHRQHDIATVFPGAQATALSATPLLADFLKRREPKGEPVLIGPDAESRQWVEAVASPLGLDVLTAEKTRRGDSDVGIVIPEIEHVSGRQAVIVDDMVSTGITLARCAELLTGAGATTVEALLVHCLAGDDALALMQRSGIASVISTDSIAHPTNGITLAPLLADALKQETNA